MTAPESSPKPAEAIAREIVEKLACFFTTGQIEAGWQGGEGAGRQHIGPL